MCNSNTVSDIASDASADAPKGLLGVQLREVAVVWATSQHSLVVLAAEFADSAEWVLDGSPSAAHWIGDVADVETSTAREWIRIGRQLTQLPVTAEAFAARCLSYSKVRTLTRVAERGNEAELVAIALQVPAGQLGVALAVWFNQHTTPEELAARQHRLRSVRWRTEPSGMVTFTLRLPPLMAATLIAMLTTIIMRSTLTVPKPDRGCSGGGPPWPNSTATPSNRSSPAPQAPSTPR